MALPAERRSSVSEMSHSNGYEGRPPTGRGSLVGLLADESGSPLGAGGRRSSVSVVPLSGGRTSIELQEIRTSAERKEANHFGDADTAGEPISPGGHVRADGRVLVAADDRASGQCRICLSDGGVDLIAPCRCRGSQCFVHRGCLDEWRATQPDGRAFTHCSVCNFEYVVSTIHSAAADYSRRLWRFRCYVIRDVTAALLLTQAIVAGLGALLMIADTHYFLRDLWPSSISSLGFFCYWLSGFLLFLAILGLCGMIAVCVGWARSPAGQNDCAPCSCYYCYCGECECASTGGGGGGGDDAAICVVLALFLLALLALFGVFVGLFLAGELARKSAARHLRILWLRGEAENSYVKDFYLLDLPIDRVNAAEELTKRNLQEDAVRRRDAAAAAAAAQARRVATFAAHSFYDDPAAAAAAAAAEDGEHVYLDDDYDDYDDDQYHNAPAGASGHRSAYTTAEGIPRGSLVSQNSQHSLLSGNGGGMNSGIEGMRRSSVSIGDVRASISAFPRISSPLSPVSSSSVIAGGPAAMLDLPGVAESTAATAGLVDSASKSVAH